MCTEKKPCGNPILRWVHSKACKAKTDAAKEAFATMCICGPHRMPGALPCPAHPNGKPHPAAEQLTHSAESCAEVARAIEQVGAAAMKLMTGPLTVRALCLLIRDAMPRGSKLELSEVQDVLEAAAVLGERHLTKES